MALEVNADPHRLDLDWRVLQQVREAGRHDLHRRRRAQHSRTSGHVEYGVGIARKGWLGPTDILNTRTAEEFIDVGRAPASLRRPARDASPPAAKAAARQAHLPASAPDLSRRACALDHADAYQLLVATILSAQCTDARVNMVTPAFFARYPRPEDLARADRAEVEELIRSTGFFRNKATSLIGMAQALVADHRGEVPRSMEELRVLPGVGRKTANVVLGNAYGINEGITVDTHVTRLSRLLGLTRHDDPIRIEQDLMPLFPREDWALLSHLLISTGGRSASPGALAAPTAWSLMSALPPPSKALPPNHFRAWLDPGGGQDSC